MKFTITIITVCMLLAPIFSFGAEFDFYGVKFGYSKDEVDKVFSTNTKYGITEAEKPGHRINKLYFTFDNNNKLYNIEVYYGLGDSREMNEALLQAINEKITDPLKNNHDIEVKSDTYTDVSKYGTYKSIVLKISSKIYSNEYIKHLKADILQKMQ